MHMKVNQVEISKEFNICDGGLSINNKNYKYQDITTLYYLVCSVNSSSRQYFGIILNDGKAYTTETSWNTSIPFLLYRWLTNSDKEELVKRISKAYVVLATKSFDSRLAQYMKQLEEKGYFEYQADNSEIIKFYKNGNVETKNKVANLKKAAKEGRLIFGTARGIEHKNYSSNPNKVIICESKHTLMAQKKVAFDCIANKDVIMPIIENIAYS